MWLSLNSPRDAEEDAHEDYEAVPTSEEEGGEFPGGSQSPTIKRVLFYSMYLLSSSLNDY